jgi:hypothetical protein
LVGRANRQAHPLNLDTRKHHFFSNKYSFSMIRKISKISAVLLVVTVIALNVHAALKSYYGIKEGSLSGQVWAQTASPTLVDPETSSTALFGVGTTTGCYVGQSFSVALTVYANYTSSASLGMTGNTITGVTLGSSGSASYSTSYVTIVTAGSQTVCNSWSGFCFNTSCVYPVGKAPYGVFYNNSTIALSTSKSSSPTP